MAKSKKTVQGRAVWLVLLGLVGLAVLMAALLRGHDIVLFSPKGLIADEQHRLMMSALLILLGIAVPTLSLLYFFAWRYREGGKRVTVNHRPADSRFGGLALWAIPVAVFLLLASRMLPATQQLDPHMSIIADQQPLVVQVVALRWKWLFVYPDQQIATVNYLQIPVDRPIQFELTADQAPMNSFWIPHLGGQLYAMTGHQNRLNLIAQTPGSYEGGAAEINGAGFTGMHFAVQAGSDEDFNRWVQQVGQSAQVLDGTTYNQLLLPSQNNPAAFYSGVQANLYDVVLSKYAGSHHHGGYQ